MKIFDLISRILVLRSPGFFIKKLVVTIDITTRVWYIIVVTRVVTTIMGLIRRK